jgi:polysaccharide export outer membrane protein
MKNRVQFAALLLLFAACWCARAQDAAGGGELPPPPPQDMTAPQAQSAVQTQLPQAQAPQTELPQAGTSPAPAVQAPVSEAPAPQAPSSVPVPLAIAAHPPVPPSEAPNTGEPQLKQNPLDVLRNFEPPPDEEYRLGRGDEITVDFAGRPDLQAKLVIGPDGRITLPLAGDLMMAGLTRPQAARAIQNALSTYYENLSVQVTVTKYTSNRVLVLGAVAKPGNYAFDGAPRLLEALTQAGLVTGGLDKPAQVPEECAIYRGNQQVIWVQLKKLLESGNSLADLRLRRDDVIYVPNMSERFVSVMGEVKNPGAIQLTISSTLASVVAQAGGFTDLAGSNPHIQVVDPSTGTSHVYRLHDVLNPVKTREIQLKPGEIVFVTRSGFGQATYVMQRLTPLFILSNLAYVAPLL